MAEPKVFFVYLRRPMSPRQSPNERRDDPFYEFGSFGCTGCHRKSLFHPDHASELKGAMLAFVQGGRRGARLVFLTPPITVTVRGDRCEARWTPAEMPFKYAEAPILVYNGGVSDFPLVDEFARNTKRTTVEGGLSSKLRSRVQLLSPKMAIQLIAVYERRRAEARPSAIATNYDEALPWPPPLIDRHRKDTYESHISELACDKDGADRVLQAVVPTLETQAQSRSGLSRRRPSGRRTRHCT